MIGAEMKVMKPLAAVVATSLIACSSGNFGVAPNPTPSTDSGVVDAGDPDTFVAPDTAIEAGVDECGEPDPTRAKFCVKVELFASHPGYGTEESKTLGLDGSGVVYVYLFDKDPSTADEKNPIDPVATLRHPKAEAIGEEVKVASSFPVTVTGTAPPGTYWMIAAFQDNKTTPRKSGESSLLPGDFVIVPMSSAKGNIYPQVKLEAAKIARLPLTLRPLRRVDATLTTSTELKTKATINDNIHGDGPAYFAIYDGDINKDASYLSGASSYCVKLPMKPTEPPASFSFATTVDGGHKIIGLVFDRQLPTGKDSLVTGTLHTSLDPSKPHLISIDGTRWVSRAEITFADVYFPPPAGTDPPDPFVCP